MFDMDGVLIDARDWHYKALNEALGYFGYKISHEDHLEKYDGLPTRTKLAALSDTQGLPIAIHPLINNIKQDRTMRYAAQHCFPTTHHQLLLGRIKADGLQIGVATNSIRKTAELMLDYARVSAFLDVLVTNEDVTLPKPSPEIYLKACASLEASPNEVLVFEDNHHGVKAAKDAGCHVIQVFGPEDVNLEQYFKFLGQQND